MEDRGAWLRGGCNPMLPAVTNLDVAGTDGRIHVESDSACRQRQVVVADYMFDGAWSAHVQRLGAIQGNCAHGLLVESWGRFLTFPLDTTL